MVHPFHTNGSRFFGIRDTHHPTALLGWTCRVVETGRPIRCGKGSVGMGAIGSMPVRRRAKKFLLEFGLGGEVD